MSQQQPRKKYTDNQTRTFEMRVACTKPFDKQPWNSIRSPDYMPGQNSVQTPNTMICPETTLSPSLFAYFTNELPETKGQAFGSQPSKTQDEATFTPGCWGNVADCIETIEVALSACSFLAWATNKLFILCWQFIFAIPSSRSSSFLSARICEAAARDRLKAAIPFTYLSLAIVSSAWALSLTVLAMDLQLAAKSTIISAFTFLSSCSCKISFPCLQDSQVRLQTEQASEFVVIACLRVATEDIDQLWALIKAAEERLNCFYAFLKDLPASVAVLIAEQAMSPTFFMLVFASSTTFVSAFTTSRALVISNSAKSLIVLLFSFKSRLSRSCCSAKAKTVVVWATISLLALVSFCNSQTRPMAAQTAFVAESWFCQICCKSY